MKNVEDSKTIISYNITYYLSISNIFDYIIDNNYLSSAPPKISTKVDNTDILHFDTPTHQVTNQW